MMERRRVRGGEGKKGNQGEEKRYRVMGKEGKRMRGTA